MDYHTKRIKVKGLLKAINILEYGAKYIPLLGSKSATKKAIEKNNLRLNRRKTSPQSTVKNGDWLELKIQKRVGKSLPTINLSIVYEDEYLVIVNKPGGIAVNGNRNKTVENALPKLSKRSTQPDALPSPTAAHRLDVPTKGLVILAKTKTALIRLNKAFQTGAVKKEYMAVVHGKPKEKGRIELAIQGKKAITDYELLRAVPSRIFQQCSLLRLHLLTGRTHQLRIHLQSIGHLIVGDKQYAGSQKTILGKGLFLCACKVELTHPINGKLLTIEIDPPAWFGKFLDREEGRFEK